ncbi:MarR family transcriptional regulator [Actinacidiphila alni]|uniref:MarR family transcriptional regulator n=1 Tax=Actinacidiphila alni TaxID=380248 RepID=UPI001FEBEC6E|nr:MarR family winged helix-turn-helix transcriptional regulator [Actinacidiphila alni]
MRSGHARARAYVQRVWETACALVGSTTSVESRNHVHEALAALRARIEATPWPGERGRTALRVLLAHLSFAEVAGGRRHAASERQTAEAAGLSRQTVRSAYDNVLKPGGWLQRLKVGRGAEGSVWYLGDGLNAQPVLVASRDQTTQRPPDRALEEWSSPETATTADIDSTVLARLMPLDAFAQQGLGSSALLILSALHANPQQDASDLIATTAISRATAYRTLRRLKSLGLVNAAGSLWALVPRALEGVGNSLAEAVTQPATPTLGWERVAALCGTAGVGVRRKAAHAAERAAYRAALEHLAARPSKAAVVVQDGRLVVVPPVRGDEIPPSWHAPGGAVIDPSTGLPVPGWRVATDGRLIHISPDDDRSYDELTTAHQQAVLAWESIA